MYPLVKSLDPIESCLSARALNWCDLAPILVRGLHPLIRMNLGIQHNIFGSVLSSWAIHFVSLSAIFVSNFIQSLSGQSMRCISVSLQPQFGHCLSRQELPEKQPTWTFVPQNPEFCSDLQILYMLVLFLSAKSKCSQSTALNLSLDHLSFLHILRCWRATSLLVWNLRATRYLLWLYFPILSAPHLLWGVAGTACCGSVESCCCDCMFCKSVTYTVELLNKG